MSEIVRKLATIEKIVSLEKHPNADTLDIIGIKGWKVISKSGQHKLDDLVVYFEIDSFLPVDERFEFLRKSGFKSTKNLGDGFRLKTIKLRGEISQGLIMPISEFTEFNDLISEGDDVTEILHIQKYEKPIPSNLVGRVRGNFPLFIPKTDEERLQNLRNRHIEPHLYDTFEMTLKMDGSSMTVYIENGIFGVCSRNLDLSETEENSFWQVANKLHLKEILSNSSQNLALQGELCGPGIQNNPHNLKDLQYYIFNIYDIDEKKYFSSIYRHKFIADLQMRGYDLKHIKILGYLKNLPSVEKALALCKQYLNDEEGIVFKSENDPSFSFKIISPEYLLKHD